ncbi:bacteriocin fulvocin C-related protein [Polaribacter sp. MSW13]|uniref:Bacteriocin fulvocin C-related protein n=1 Tax=Polaribacter marinus TaxID=2916838 RepID=A0A9X1VNA1_9FLAO|nr:bacteriocin fulvocin C-related protein [Polaribacter marinus]MCI2229190.1 bacteriocin fulvocin C-related protein [Polaribacter marinus]
MKKVIFFSRLICTVILSLFFTSCSESVDHEFSYDSKINAWVKTNKKEILNYSRDDIKLFSEKKQKAILRIMPANKKKEIWQEKVDYILKMNLSKEEKVFLKLFTETFKEIDYKSPISKEFTEELDKKVTLGAKKFNWSKEFVHNTFFTIKDVNLVENDFVSKEDKLEARGGEQDNCNCTPSFWGCTGYNNDCSKPDKCETNNGDCGVWGTSNCTGYCTGDLTQN